jgi:hypothetical protein
LAAVPNRQVSAAHPWLVLIQARYAVADRAEG